MRIALPLITGLVWNQPVVSAELVNIAPHLEDETFAVHRCPNTKSKWQITHVETGFKAGPDSRNRTVAIREGRKILATKTPADFARAVEAAVKAAPWIADPTAYDLFKTTIDHHPDQVDGTA